MWGSLDLKSSKITDPVFKHGIERETSFEKSFDRDFAINFEFFDRLIVLKF